MRLEEIRGGIEERVPRAPAQSGDEWDNGGGRRSGRRGRRRSRKSTDLADSAEHDDEGDRKGNHE